MQATIGTAKMATPTKFRDLGIYEHLFAAYAENGAMVFSIGASVRGQIEEEQLVHSLNTVQARHALLSVSIGWDDNDAHAFFVSDNPIPLEIITEGDLEWQRIAEDELNRPFDPSTGPLVRAVISHGKDTTTIGLTFHHSIADGLGAVSVLDEILKVLGGRTLPGTIPSVTFEKRLGIDMPRFMRQTSAGKFAVARSPLTDVHWHPAKESVVELGRQRADRLFRIAKAEGVTVNSMLTAAMARAQLELDNQWSSKVLRIMTPINLKPLLSISEQVGVFISIGLTTFHHAELDFWEEARRVGMNIDKFRSKDIAVRVIGDLAQRLIEDPSYVFSSERLLDQTPFDSVMTNLGVMHLPDTYGILDLEKLWAPALRSIPGQNVVAAATLGGVLSLVHTSVDGTRGLLAKMLSILDSL